MRKKERESEMKMGQGGRVMNKNREQEELKAEEKIFKIAQNF